LTLPARQVGVAVTVTVGAATVTVETATVTVTGAQDAAPAGPEAGPDGRAEAGEFPPAPEFPFAPEFAPAVVDEATATTVTYLVEVEVPRIVVVKPVDEAAAGVTAALFPEPTVAGLVA